MTTKRALALAGGLALAAACGPAGERAEHAAGPGPPGPGGERPPEAPSGTTIATAPVTLLFPAASGEGLAAEAGEIFATADPGARAKQVIVALLAGPRGEGAVRALPEGTALRQVYVLEDGTAWVDLSDDARLGLGGGSAAERLAVFAVVDSVVFNVPEITRVGILVEGRPVETLNGHLDLRRPLPLDRSLLPQG